MKTLLQLRQESGLTQQEVADNLPRKYKIRAYVISILERFEYFSKILRDFYKGVKRD